MIIYKVFECSKCKTIIELQYDEAEKVYVGDCKTCKRKIKTNAVGDERDIKKKLKKKFEIEGEQKK